MPLTFLPERGRVWKWFALLLLGGVIAVAALTLFGVGQADLGHLTDEQQTELLAVPRPKGASGGDAVTFRRATCASDNSPVSPAEAERTFTFATSSDLAKGRAAVGKWLRLHGYNQNMAFRPGLDDFVPVDVENHEIYLEANGEATLHLILIASPARCGF